jgi:hypothetical protein
MRRPGTSKGQQVGEQTPDLGEANAVWSEWKKSDWVDEAWEEMGQDFLKTPWTRKQDSESSP